MEAGAVGERDSLERALCFYSDAGGQMHSSGQSESRTRAAFRWGCFRLKRGDLSAAIYAGGPV